MLLLKFVRLGYSALAWIANVSFGSPTRASRVATARGTRATFSTMSVSDAAESTWQPDTRPTAARTARG